MNDHELNEFLDAQPVAEATDALTKAIKEYVRAEVRRQLWDALASLDIR